jgi:hypothetical protein
MTYSSQKAIPSEPGAAMVAGSTWNRIALLLMSNDEKS